MLNNDTLHYEVLGRGKPIIFLPGRTSSWRYWVPALLAASANHRAYVIDLLKDENNSKGIKTSASNKQIELIHSFFKQMGMEKIALISHDLGVLLSLDFTDNYLNLVDRLLLVSFPLTQGSLKAGLKNHFPNSLINSFFFRTSMMNANKYIGLDSQDESLQFEAFEKDSQKKITEIWNRISIPCLVVYGQYDPIISPPSLEEARKLPENFHVIVFEESGHFPMLDEQNKFNRLLADFLALKPGESPRNLQLKKEWKRRLR
jgi:pimeloyl-ACP methyl ester carboxylesterase